MKLQKGDRIWERNMGRTNLPWQSEIETLEFLQSFVRLIKPHLILEIGTFEGDSAIAMGTALKRNKLGHLYTYDVKDFEQAKVIRSRGLEEWVSAIIGTVPANTAPESFDMAFIDDGHSYSEVLRDLILCNSAVKNGGYILGHDVVKTETVKRAYQDFLKKYSYENVVLDSYAGLFIIRKK